MIITLTLNPAIDKTLTLASFDPHKMNRALLSTQDPGGKGINVSKVIHALSGKSTAMGIIGGSAGEFIQSNLSGKGIDTDFLHISDETRINLKIFCKDNQETIEVNESGPVISEETLEQLKANLFEKLENGTICVVSGSVPIGVDKGFYKELISQMKAQGAIVILDADGELFKQAIHAKPDYIKPNLKELEAYFDKTVKSHEDFKACGRYFLELGIPNVIFSLGSEGAFYMNSEAAYLAHPLKIEAHSSVGAGDAFVGALAYSIEKKLTVTDSLQLAIATSAGAVMTMGTNPADLSWIEAHKHQVIVEKI